jgi:hypothetical protein
MASIEARLEKLEAQHIGGGVFTHYPGEPFAIECATGRCIALADVPDDCTMIEIVYASMADLGNAARGYLTGDTLEDLENKAAELPADLGPLKGYIGVSPEDWEKIE